MRYKKNPPFLFRTGAIIGYTCLFLIFSFVSPEKFKLGFRLGMLSPLQGISLIGLTLGIDPLARLWGMPGLARLGDLSYPQVSKSNHMFKHSSLLYS